MLRALSGLPGGGKSRQAMRLIIRELLQTQRPIWTNVKVEFHPWVLNGVLQMGLIEWLRRRGHLEASKTCQDRIRPLSDTMVKRFWEYRYSDKPVTTVVWQDSKGEVYDINDEQTARRIKSQDLVLVCKAGIEADGGVFYVLDEVHDHFNSHEWQTVGKSCLWYASKHRHFGDDIYLVSQAMSNVVKQFRVLIQETLMVTNLGMQRLGKFRMPQKTVVKAYLRCPEKVDGIDPLWVELIGNTNDQVQECYNTAAAVTGSSADVGKPQVKGLHWGWAIFGIVAVVVGFLQFGPTILAKVTDPKVATKTTPTNAPAVQQVAQAKPSTPEAPIFQVNPTLTMIGFARMKDRWQVRLSDGQVITQEDFRVTSVGPDHITIGKQRIPYVAPEQQAQDIPPTQAATTEPLFAPGTTRRVSIVSQGLRVGQDGTWQNMPTARLHASN